MQKGTMISFRATEDFGNILKEIARSKKTTVSGLIDSILREYLETQVKREDLLGDRRKFPRHRGTIPAIINGQNGKKVVFHASKITDISLGGVNLVVPKDDLSDGYVNDSLGHFEVVFALPEQEKPIMFMCQAERIDQARDCYRIGASFADTDMNSYQALQNYLC